MCADFVAKLLSYRELFKTVGKCEKLCGNVSNVRNGEEIAQISDIANTSSANTFRVADYWRAAWTLHASSKFDLMAMA
jgi:hypothetical protein